MKDQTERCYDISEHTAIIQDRETRRQKQIERDIEEGSRCSICSKQFVREINDEGADVEISYSHEEPVACKKCWSEELEIEIQDDKCFTG